MDVYFLPNREGALWDPEFQGTGKGRIWEELETSEVVVFCLGVFGDVYVGLVRVVIGEEYRHWKEVVSEGRGNNIEGMRVIWSFVFLEDH